MRKYWKEILLALVLGLALPWAVAAAGKKSPGPATEITATGATETTTAPTETAARTLKVLQDGQTVEMDLDEYLTGVLLGEIPADFEPEAKKAQAVVARTYALRCAGGHSKHPEADVCTDAACCQGYRTPEDYLFSGGTQEAIDSAAEAVTATHGQVLTYDGALIEATYFSCSGGRTEDAVAVWGTDVPYLRSTDSPGEEKATHYMDTVTFSAEEFQNLLGADLSGLPGSWFGEITYTDGDGVDTIDIGGETYSGTAIRKALGLRSTAFVISGVGDSVIVTTKGFGHRVGMSQYGADAMAASGSTYAEILAHYYAGTVLTAVD